MQARTCDDISDSKQIPAWSMDCTFALYNGVSNTPVATRTVACAENAWERNNTTLFEDFVFEEKTLWRSSLMITEQITNGVLWEYQLVLQQVAYTVCGSWRTLFNGVSDNRICSMNFAVSDDYVITQWSSLTTSSDTDLSMFKWINGESILSAGQLVATQKASLADIDSSELESSIQSFVSKHVPLAVVQTSDMNKYSRQSFTKTVNKDIYVYDGDKWLNTSELVIRWWDTQQLQWKTIIVLNADLIVEWSVYGNTMRVVPNDDIIFRSIDCDERDIVQWIYVTKRTFKTDLVVDGRIESNFKNTDLSRTERCDDGRLVIDGILLGPSPDNQFISSRRSSLQSWFDITYTDQVSKVYDGASLLMKSNATIRSYLPDGIDMFEWLIEIFR